MNSKAQAGLEYLMTYGWALVIIVTVASILFFVVAPPGNQFACTSSDPTKIVLESYNLPYSKNMMYDYCPAPYALCEIWGMSSFGDLPGKMVLVNGTGGNIAITKVSAIYDSYTIAPDCTVVKSFTPSRINGVDYSAITPSNPVNVASGSKINIDELYIFVFSGSCDLPDFSGTKTFAIQYKNQFGYTKDMNVFCKGYPPKT